jgi:DNA topoisomerase VI subunit B
MTAPNLARKAFTTSRLAEFASVSELIRQTGQPAENWPLVIVKELIDNALDAAEEANMVPVVEVAVDENSITVTDQGPGIAPATVASLIDYTSRTSSRAALVSPARGAQGNALQTILAMPFALDGRRGKVLIESQGVVHDISFTIDPVRQIPIVNRATGPSAVKIGARVTVDWPRQAGSLIEDARDRFLPLVDDYGWLNPHLDLSARVFDGSRSLQATDPGWTK